MGNHAARPRAVTRKGAVHHGEHAPVDLLLDHQQIHQRFVDDRMRPVPTLVQQTAEGVLHGTGGGGENVSLDRGQMDDVFPDKSLRDVEAIGVHIVEA